MPVPQKFIVSGSVQVVTWKARVLHHLLFAQEMLVGRAKKALERDGESLGVLIGIQRPRQRLIVRDHVLMIGIELEDTQSQRRSQLRIELRAIERRRRPRPIMGPFLGRR